MAIRFAKQAGNWSDPLTWDGGLTVPTTGDEVYLNGYNITFDQDATVGFIANSITPVGVPQSFIPNMLSNTSPNTVGQAFATQNDVNAWKAFRKSITTFSPNSDGWIGTTNRGQIGYQFNTPKNIQRYSWYSNNGNAGNRPKDWTFEGSNDGVTWTTLHTIVGSASVASYVSPVISNPSSYIYYRLNITACINFTSPAIINALDMSETTDVLNGYQSGGTATISTSRTVNADLYHSAGTTLISVIANTPDIVTFVGDMPGSATSVNSSRGIGITGNVTVNYIGDIFATSVSGVYGTTGIQASTGTLNITGNVTGGTNNGNAPNTAGIRASSGIINIVGNVYATTIGGRDNYGIFNGAGVINITGQVYGSPSAINPYNAGIQLGNSTSTIIVVGGINAANGSSAIYGPLNSSSILLYGNATNSIDGTMAAIVSKLFIESTSQWEFRKSNLTTNTLYTPGVATGHPAEANVRTGITYGPTNNLTGTCAVPPAAAVSIGVPVDNTTGTAYLSGNDISNAVWDTQTTNLTTAGSIGERLKDASTVDTTAATVAAYDI